MHPLTQKLLAEGVLNEGNEASVQLADKLVWEHHNQLMRTAEHYRQERNSLAGKLGRKVYASK